MKLHIIIIGTLLLLVGIQLPLIAQDGKSREERKKAALEFRAEVKAYVSQEIIPVMKPQRLKLNHVLSTEEQNEIADIRTALKEKKEAKKAQRAEFGKRKKEGHTLTEAERLAIITEMKEMRQLITRAWVIVDAHEAEIDRLLTEVSGNFEGWKTEIHNIASAHRPKREKGEFHHEKGAHKGHHSGRRGPHRKRGMGRMGMAGANFQEFTRPLGFLLWNPDDVLPLANETDLHVFPNPSQSSNTLSFVVSQAGEVHIELINDKAQVLKTVLKESKEAGTHSLQVDLSELEEGLYFYRIKTVSGVETEKLLIKR